MKAVFAILLSAVTFLAVAQSTPSYVTNGSGQIVKTGTGLCLHTGTYTPANAVKGCDPVKEVERKPVTISGDVLFAFDLAALTVKGQELLNSMFKRITAASTVTVVGHTDQIGTAAYNLKLSQQRAQAAADYLNAKTGFNAKFNVQGVGSAQPVPGTELCNGMKDFERYKACLAPNRRVVITIK